MYRKLADLAGCSIGTITNILVYHNHYGTSVNPFRYYPGHPCLLDEQDQVYIDSLLQCEPTIHLDEIQVKLPDDRDLDISIAYIQQAINQLEITCKMNNTCNDINPKVQDEK